VLLFDSKCYLIKIFILVEPGSPDESALSGSNFEATQNSIKACHQKKADAGHLFTDTEGDDDAIDRQLQNSMTESDASSDRQLKHEKKQGKQRVIDRPEDSSSGDDNGRD
jgi:hypothetical protein